jgi:hypothetical protein
MKGTAKTYTPAPSERGTKILAFPLTLFIMDVRIVLRVQQVDSHQPSGDNGA